MVLIMSGLNWDGGVHQSSGRPSTMLCITNEATFKSPRDTPRPSLLPSPPLSIVSSFFSGREAVALGGLLSLSDPTIHATDP